MSLNTPDSTHNEAIRQEFQKQAASFSDARYTYQLDWMIKELDPQPDDAVLDVAAGTGHIARPLAAQARYVVALDLTPEMLRLGKAEADASGMHNILFELGDAAHIPYLDASFNLVTSRFAVHHFEDPKLQLAEMVRVCRPGGRIGIIDIVVASEPAIAREHNRLERLRDQTHTEAFSLEGLVNLLGKLGAPATRHSTLDAELSVNSWLTSSQTPTERAEQVRAALQDEINGGPVTGMCPFLRDGKLCFIHTWAVVVGVKA
ncbi:MAG TPA: methyltransferase domain-containing protein [Ktedonobacteraceae bacterium]